MQQYLDLIKYVLENGDKRQDRTEKEKVFLTAST